MINTKFMKSMEYSILYSRKPDTKSSFYYQSGKKGVFPNRINVNLTGDGFRRIASTGRALAFKKRGEIKAAFTKSEHGSPYQLCKKSRIHFSLWEAKDYPFLLGFSSIGRTNINGKIEDTNDLAVVLGDADQIEIRIYPGAYNKREDIFKQIRSEL